ncbi:hypothetical protein CC86DRAFT_12572 [Ophiobolus disseminans]|uniref:Uncharacterized protein n=1 Tax=Ophiobolus disseminans TaxID=1469910 RepID=A0A6A7AKW6_9PLEO|nr:hypothetical protein CC86DRAFT_12572 [Ophiobolus disseminans]
MRGKLASIAAAAATTFTLIILLYTSAPTSWTLRKSAPGPVIGQGPYLGWPDPLPWNPPKPKDASEGQSAERTIIKVKLENEDASWISKLEPTWPSEIISIKPMYSNAHPKAHRPDKGRVANAYLAWIIENYNNLPETLVFLPPSDAFGEETLNLREAIPELQIPYIQSSGFANLHCPTSKSQTTCNGRSLNPHKPSYEFRTLEAKIPEVWKECFGDQAGVPGRIASVLGSEFVVSKEHVMRRSVDDYLKLWGWLNKTIMDDDSSGLVFEYIWHIVFGKDAIFCPEERRCECDLYGNC